MWSDKGIQVMSIRGRRRSRCIGSAIRILPLRAWDTLAAYPLFATTTLGELLTSSHNPT